MKSALGPSDHFVVVAFVPGSSFSGQMRVQRSKSSGRDCILTIDPSTTVEFRAWGEYLVTQAFASINLLVSLLAPWLCRLSLPRKFSGKLLTCLTMSKKFRLTMMQEFISTSCVMTGTCQTLPNHRVHHKRARLATTGSWTW